MILFLLNFVDTVKLQAVDQSTNFELFWPKVSIHKDQISLQKQSENP